MRRYIQSIMALILLLMLIEPSAVNAEQPEMDVHFIDVGQGDSIFIQTPSGKNILIDGGPPKAGKKVVSYLKQHNVEEIDLLIATHPDIDHIGGLVRVMKTFNVKRIIDSGKLYSTKTYARYVSEILKQHIPVKVAKQNDYIVADTKMYMRVLNTHARSKNNNESSIALRISFKDIDFLLMGDVTKKQEKKIMNKYYVESEILKVAHHGSNTSTSLEFLKTVKPKLAILTYSRKNKYGHPVDRVIKNLNKVQADIYSTAMFGDIHIETDGEDYMILNEKDPTDNLKAG